MPANMNDLKIFSGRANPALTTRICDYLGLPLGRINLGNFPDGEIFNAITKGVRNMPSYGYQVPPEDRWAIISWVRVLGRSQHASLGDVPDNQKSSIEPEGGSK